MKDAIIRVNFHNRSSQSAQFPGEVEIEFQDALSGTLLGRVRMSAGRFHQLTLGTSLTFNGQISDKLDHVGKKQRVEQIRVERDLVPFGVRDAEQVERIVSDAGLVPDYWESWGAYLHNYGWGLTGRWWVDLTDEELADFKADQLIYNEEVTY